MTTPRQAWLVTPGGIVDHDVANDAMHTLADRRLAGEIPDVVIALEHAPVFTAGRRAKPEDLLWDEDAIRARGGSVRRIDRGGAFTFHGGRRLVVWRAEPVARPDAYRRAAIRVRRKS